MTRPDTDNGEAFTVEETDPGIREMVSAVSVDLGVAPSADGRTHAQELAAELMKLANGGGGDGPIDITKKLKRHNWIFAVVIALFGSGGVVASYYATEARSVENAGAIDTHSKQPAHKAATKRIDTVERGLDAVQTDIGEINEQQTEIGKGIDQLKREAQTEKQRRTENELEELKRENRRLRRSR